MVGTLDYVFTCCGIDDCDCTNFGAWTVYLHIILEL
jgi:hypothetical protein